MANQQSSSSLWLLFDMCFFSAGGFDSLGFSWTLCLTYPTSHFLSRKGLLLQVKENQVHPAALTWHLGFKPTQPFNNHLWDTCSTSSTFLSSRDTDMSMRGHWCSRNAQTQWYCSAENARAGWACGPPLPVKWQLHWFYRVLGTRQQIEYRSTFCGLF